MLGQRTVNRNTKLTKYTNGYHELVACNDWSSNLPWTAFRLEHRNANRQNTHSQTSDNPANGQMHPRVHGGDLDDVPNHKHQDANSQIATPSKPVRSVRACQCTYHGADGHERDDEGFDCCIEGDRAVGLGLTETVDKVWEEQRGRYLACIIAEEEPADGGDCSEHEGFDTTFCATDTDGTIGAVSMVVSDV
jgi:hypothetical protein